MSRDRNRRHFLATLGTGVTLSFAGCIGDDDGTDDDDDNGDEPETDDGTDDTPDEENGEDDPNGEEDNDGADELLEPFLEDANGYDGTFEDWTGEDDVEIIVTSEGGNSFDPAAVEISDGTTVTWVWEDGGHSSTYTDLEEQDRGELWDSGILDDGDEYEYTFDGVGDYAYVCVPHEGQGHIGGIRITE